MQICSESNGSFAGRSSSRAAINMTSIDQDRRWGHYVFSVQVCSAALRCNSCFETAWLSRCENIFILASALLSQLSTSQKSRNTCAHACAMCLIWPTCLHKLGSRSACNSLPQCFIGHVAAVVGPHVFYHMLREHESYPWRFWRSFSAGVKYLVMLVGISLTYFGEPDL